jgi:cytochrome c2
MHRPFPFADVLSTVQVVAWARSSVVEHTLHTGGVASSILAAPTTLNFGLIPKGTDMARSLIISLSCLSLLAGCSGKQPEATEPTVPAETASAVPESKGATLFAKCAACHALEAGKNLIGPSLHGVVGRKAASAPGFVYSDAMKSSGITWTDAELSDYLTQPQKKVPGTKMSFPGLPDAQDRAELIAYLKEKAK